MTDMPDPNAGDALAYEEAWEHRIPDDGGPSAEERALRRRAAVHHQAELSDRPEVDDDA